MDVALLPAYVRDVSLECMKLIERQGWSVKPHLPGFSRGIEPVGNSTRLVCAAELIADNAVVGIIISLFIAGRRPTFTVAPATCAIPKQWNKLVLAEPPDGDVQGADPSNLGFLSCTQGTS
jgi:hypothetical protein